LWPRLRGAARDLHVAKELLDHVVQGPMSQDELESMFRLLKKAVIERAMRVVEDKDFEPRQDAYTIS
jgi:hypothetical protein